MALIDVTFFLLAFAMLIGRMDATAPFDVTPPVAGVGADLPAGGLTVALAQDGRIAIDGSEAPLAAVGARLRQVAPGGQVRIQAHRDAELRHVLPVIDLVEAAGAQPLLIVTPRAP